MPKQQPSTSKGIHVGKGTGYGKRTMQEYVNYISGDVHKRFKLHETTQEREIRVCENSNDDKNGNPVTFNWCTAKSCAGLEYCKPGFTHEVCMYDIYFNLTKKFS